MFYRQIRKQPKLFNASAGEEAIMRLNAAVAGDEAVDIRRVLNDILAGPEARAFLAATFSASPFLATLAARQPQVLTRLAEHGAEAALARLLEETAAVPLAPYDGAGVALRRLKQQVALLVGLADVAGVWDLETVTASLTRFADAATRKAVDVALHRAASAGQIILDDPENPGAGCAYTMLAMGKMGSGELNYSSDIDLIALFDSQAARVAEHTHPQKAFVRLTQDVVNLLQERTAHGYVFRVDLRLRPDPSSTPLAVSINGAFTYYETVGQNWERAAFIKARPVGGDEALGARFLKELAPFVWRKYLDFAAIQDIHSIKRQIDLRHGGLDEDTGKGFNVKLGKGGIREIEFFAQTQQLIWGGKEPELRISRTCEALQALARNRHINPDHVPPLVETYRYLRTLEHRLQMVADEQTHTLPDDEEARRRIAAFMGYDSSAALMDDLARHTEAVRRVSLELFKDSHELTHEGNLVFTGVEHDPQTLATIRGMGFAEPETVSTIIRSWHHGTRRATRTKRARELLTELVPDILTAFGKTPDPDLAFNRFDEFLGRLPAVVQLFSLFTANPKLLELIAAILGYSPLLSESLSRKPMLIDGPLYPRFYTALPGREQLDAEFATLAAYARNPEERLNSIRRVVQERQFQAGVHLLKNLIPVPRANALLSDLAEAALAHVIDATTEAFAEDYGTFQGASLAVLAFGKLGGREMTLNSDLDLVFVYHAEDEEERSSGERSFNPNVYFTRLVQRILTNLTSLSNEGRLYEVDTRLRPHGASGAMVVSVGALREYYEQSAWGFELLSLSRARPVYGTPAVVERLDGVISGTLCSGRFDAETLRPHVRDIRDKIAGQHKPRSPLDIKYLPGGLVDGEILAQYLQVTHGKAHPGCLRSNTAEAYEALGEAGIIPASLAATMAGHLRFLCAVQTVLRLLGGQPVSDTPDGGPVKALLAANLGMADFPALLDAIRHTCDTVYQTFTAYLPEP